MRTLAIDTATEACSVALFDDGDLVTGTFEVLGRGHAERLVPMIAELPGNGRADRIAVALGPGSFTGTRVGIAAARALAFAWGASLVGYPSLALVAAMAREHAGECAVDVAMTGGHGEWFVASFDKSGAAPAPMASLRPEEAAALLQADLVAGNQSEGLVAVRGFGKALPLLPDARSFAILPPRSLVDDVRPIYGRAPDAKKQAAST